MKYLLLFTIISILSYHAFAQPKNQDLSKTDPRLNNGFLMIDMKLTGAEYKGNMPSGTDGASNTKLLMDFSKLQAVAMKGGKSKYLFKTIPYFSFTSWLADTVKHDTELLTKVLKHEQGHYDVQLIMAAELKKQLSETWFDTYNYADDMLAIRDKISRDGARVNQLYEMETRNGRDGEAQSKWDELIGKKNWLALITYIKGKI